MRQHTKKISVNRTQALLPVSSNRRYKLSHLLCASAAFVLSQASSAYANPTGADVTSGSATVSTPSAGNLVVNQGSDKVIINWQNFDILSGESTQFIQPSSSSVALNRIKDGNPTQILGSLSANGKLMLVNPNGVFFGENSRVDVAGLIASTADTSDADFLSGKINLSVAGKADAAIINKGNITATDGGLVALVAPSVRNDGIIQANLGTVALASAETASVDFYGDNLYSFALDKEATSSASGVVNSGTIAAAGGKVLMTAKVAKNVVDNVINNTGIIEASSAHMEGGTVVLDGGTGNVKVSGKINASGKTGGTVTVTGENIALAAADIDASGANGGGSVKIGGDYQGGGTLAHAKKVTVDSASKINVSATDNGNGGTSIVWSDEVTDFNGSILGTGGVNGGNGGFAEVSSKGELGYNGAADLHADNGDNGTLLLDPDSLFIGSFTDHYDGTDHFVNYAPLVATLQGGTNVVATAINNVSVLADMIWSGSGSLTIDAGNYAIIEADIKSSFAGLNPSKGAVTINAGNRVQMGNADVETKTGDITTNSIEMYMSNSTLKSAFGNVVVNNSGKFTSNTSDVLSGKSVTLHQSTDGSIQNAINALGPTGSGGALLQLGSGTFNQDFYINDSNVTVQGNGALNTIINAAYGFSTVIFVNGGSNVTISDLTVSGGTLGVFAKDTTGFGLFDTIVSGASGAGVKLYNTKNTKVNGNYIINNLYGIDSELSLLTDVIGNGFTGNQTAIYFDNGKWLTVKYNAIYGAPTYAGIVLRDVTQSPIMFNSINNVQYGIDINGGSSLVIAANDFNNAYNGIYSYDTAGLLVAGNNFSGDSTGGDAIRNELGSNFTAIKNTIDNYYNGIVVLGTNVASILNNTITNALGNGIYVGSMFVESEGDYETFAPLFFTSVASNNVLINNNSVDGSSSGIVVDGVDQATVSNNTVTNAFYGIAAYYVNGLVVSGNDVSNSYIGAYTYGTAGATFNSNNLHDNLYGSYFQYSDGLSHNANTYTNNFYGAYLDNSHNAILTGDTFVDNNVGITVYNSVNAFIDGANITNPELESEEDTSIGINIVSSSFSEEGRQEKSIFALEEGGYLSNAVVRGTTITGGDIGVVVDGAGSSMQFLSDTSNFSDMNRYFVLRNDAMFADGSLAQADSLDASQQTFDGVRGSDFTLADLTAAEFITTDVEDGIPPIGNVFYKFFAPEVPEVPEVPVTPIVFNLFGADRSQFPEAPVFGLFSYAGRTITNNSGVTPPAFDVNTLNLSLLSPAAGTIPANPGNLSPAQLGGLEPAAGGNNPQALASLEPAAGGAADGNCGNNFLGSGFSNNFNAATCNLNQQ